MPYVSVILLYFALYTTVHCTPQCTVELQCTAVLTAVHWFCDLLVSVQGAGTGDSAEQLGTFEPLLFYVYVSLCMDGKLSYR